MDTVEERDTVSETTYSIWITLAIFQHNCFITIYIQVLAFETGSSNNYNFNVNVNGDDLSEEDHNQHISNLQQGFDSSQNSGGSLGKLT